MNKVHAGDATNSPPTDGQFKWVRGKDVLFFLIHGTYITLQN